MGRSAIKGNGGFLGVDTRRFISSSGVISERKARVERLDGKLAPVYGDIVLIDENFSSGDFSNWTVVNTNTSTKRFIVGSGTGIKNRLGTTITPPSGATYAAFPANSSGRNTYIKNTDVHFYKDIDIPSGIDKLTLTFDWMCQGENFSGGSTPENSYDYGYIGFADTSFTPVQNTEYDLTEGTNYQRITNTNISDFNANFGKINCQDASTNPRCPVGRNPTDATEDFVSDSMTINGTTITLGSLWQTGVTRRLVFSWKSDGSEQNQPSWTVTNIKLVANF